VARTQSLPLCCSLPLCANSVVVWLRALPSSADADPCMSMSSSCVVSAASLASAGPISSTNYGRLQGDVGRQAWALFPGLQGGYLAAGEADADAGVGLPKSDLEKMSKEELVQVALGLQHELRQAR
jgi:hypothetical protein